MENKINFDSDSCKATINGVDLVKTTYETAGNLIGNVRMQLDNVITLMDTVCADFDETQKIVDAQEMLRAAQVYLSKNAESVKGVQ